jgi:G protein beta subunit-like protein
MGSTVVLATAGYDHTIRFWEATSGICYRTLQYADSQVNTLEITADKSLIAAAGNPHIRIFEVNSNNPQPIVSFDGHTGNVTAVGFGKESKLMYSASEDGTVKLWDLRATGPQREFAHKSTAVNAAVLHPNQQELISGDQQGNIRVWDLVADACSCELVPEIGVPIRSLTAAQDSSLMVAANNSGTCYVWRSLKGGAQQNSTHFEPLHKLKAHSAQVLKCLLSPDVRQLATTSADKTVKLWNLDSFTLERTLTGHQRWVWDCVFSVDAAYLVTASSDCTARLWDLSTGDAIRLYSGHHKACVTCALNDSALEDREASIP